MFSTWDLVRPSLWHPMASTEQSMMDLDQLANQLMASSLVMSPTLSDDDEFFKDLPMKEQEQDLAKIQPQSPQEGTRAYSSYSYSTSSVVDDQQRHIVTTRRRYEDSTGRLKAVHEREIDGKKIKTMWNRQNAQDEGEHRVTCLGTSAVEFEELWRDTPFGKAQAKSLKEHQEQQYKTTSVDEGQKGGSDDQKKEQVEQLAQQRKETLSHQGTQQQEPQQEPENQPMQTE